jgi:hypothetical protein
MHHNNNGLLGHLMNQLSQMLLMTSPDDQIVTHKTRYIPWLLIRNVTYHSGEVDIKTPCYHYHYLPATILILIIIINDNNTTHVIS